MTVIHMSEKGQVVVPKEIRDRRGYTNGTAFSILETKDGSIFLKPIKHRPKLELVEHLRRLRGLEIEIAERQHHCPPRV